MSPSLLYKGVVKYRFIQLKKVALSDENNLFTRKSKQTMALSEIKLTESEQILYFKRLLITLKSQFEEKLQVLNSKLQEELLKNQTLTQQLETSYQNASHLSGSHEEELESLKKQLLTLRDLVKESRQNNFSGEAEKSSSIEFEVSSESHCFKEEIEKKNEQITSLEATLEQERLDYKLELELLNEKLAFYKAQDDQHEMITSQTSSYQLRQELDFIKHTLKQEAQEAKTLEVRYADLFNDKMHLEHQLKSLNENSIKQNHSNEALTKQVEEVTDLNHALNLTIQEKEERIVSEIQIQTDLLEQFRVLEEKTLALLPLQEKYEQLKEEYLQNHKHLDETLELYTDMEQRLKSLQEVSSEQADELTDKRLELESLIQERGHLLADIEHLHLLLEDSEVNLKTAQQHLAKKVKESTMLLEQTEEQQVSLKEYLQDRESNQSQICTLQTNLEGLQKREEKLQEQLQEALKSTESQVAKWEKKYFEMYDKWQASENQILELKKLEEKHAQMQKLLSSLGSYMGSTSSPSEIVQAVNESVELESGADESVSDSSQNTFNHSSLSKEDLVEIQEKLLSSAKLFTDS